MISRPCSNTSTSTKAARSHASPFPNLPEKARLLIGLVLPPCWAAGRLLPVVDHLPHDKDDEDDDEC